MDAEEIEAMIHKLCKALSGEKEEQPEEIVPCKNPKKSITVNTVTCLICGKAGKVLTKSHLAKHGMTPAEYRETFGIKKGTPLIAKALIKARREKMQEMKLWLRKKS